MKFAFRADASSTIGTGHVVRCATLADELQLRGARVVFFCREAPGHMCGWLEDKGYEVRRLPGPASSPPQEIRHMHAALGAERFDWLVVDHYGLDATWERAMAPLGGARFVIDDIFRVHDCEALLDQNVLDESTAYSDLVPKHCRQLVGPRYGLLRPEFAIARQVRRHRAGTLDKILVSFGGTDPSNETAGAIEGFLRSSLIHAQATVVLGRGNTRRSDIRQQYVNSHRIRFIDHCDDMAVLMDWADIAIGAGGSTSWERCCMGLPTIAVEVAENQHTAVRALSLHGAILAIDNITVVDNALNMLHKNADLLIQMSQQAENLVDGLGTLRVADVLCSSL